MPAMEINTTAMIESIATRRDVAPKDPLLSPDDNSKRGRVDADDSDKSYSSSKKRIRVSRACDQCRKRKDRCDGRQPCCKPCMRANRVCSYYPSKKRGLRTGYVRSLEILLGLVFRAIEGSESWMLAAIDGSGKTVALGSLADEPDAPDILFDAWRRSSVVKEVERLLCLAESAEEDDVPAETLEARLSRCATRAQSVNSSAMNEMTSNPDTIPLPTVPQRSPANIPVMAEAMPVTTMQTRRVTDPGDELLLATSEKSDICSSQLPADWSSLLEIYFANTHCWFPISQKHDLLRTAHMLAASNNGVSSTPGTTSLPSLGDRAFLWAVLTFSYHQSQYLEARGNNGSTESPAALQVQHIYNKAHRFILDGDQANHHQLGHVQALLLLALFHMDRRCWDTAWLFVGKAVYLAVNIAKVKLATRQREEHSSGLPPSPAENNISDGTKRVLLGCFVLETLVAARLGERTYFRSTDIQHVGLLQVESMEEWEQWQPRIGQNLDEHGRLSLCNVLGDRTPGFALSTFNQYVHLTGLLNDCLEQSSGSSCCSRETHIHVLAQNLRGWQEQLSVHHSQSTCSAYESPQVLSLRLVSLSLVALIQTNKICLAGGINLDITGTRTLLVKLQEMCGVLEKRLHVLGPHCVPPGIQGCLYILCQSLDRQSKCQGDLLLRRDMQAMQISLADLDDLCHKTKQYQAITVPSPAHTPQSDIYMTSLTPSAAKILDQYPGAHDGQGSLSQHHNEPYLTPSTQRETERLENTADDLLSRTAHQQLHSLENRPRMFDDSLSSSGLRQQGTSLPVPQQQHAEHAHPPEGLTSAQSTFQSATTPSPFSHDVSHSSIGEILSSETDEDTLFDSLATLDSVEWFANPPLFMEHLGVLRAPVATDISTLFDS